MGFVRHKLVLLNVLLSNTKTTRIATRKQHQFTVLLVALLVSKKAEKPLQNAKDGRARTAERPLCKGANVLLSLGNYDPERA